MRRGAIIFAVIAVLLIGNGWYLIATNNNVGGDTGDLFGNQHHFLSAGQEVLISGILLGVAAIIMWTAAWLRRDRGSAAAEAAKAQAAPEAKAASEAQGASQAETQVAAGQGEIQKELSDQRES